MIRDLIFIDESWRPYHGLVGGSNARKSIAGYSEAAFGCKNCTRNCGYPERPVLLAVSCRPQPCLVMYNFMELLKAIRAETGLTQSAFAERLGVSTVLIAMLKTGQKEPTKKFVNNLAEKMNVMPQSIIPFVYSINKYNENDMSKLEKQLIKLGIKLQSELVKKKAKEHFKWTIDIRILG